ncbi:unnamed protein product [Linum tenue]|uniref:Dirigent protein n=1 Tax=Linum tenue TaxID=586396 RepID=A0AAV0J127_9ROSI|nr:unnamed protein product [Linum tenue]
MAKSLHISSFLLTLLILTSALSFSLITAKKPKSRDGYSRVLSPATLRLKKEKLSHLRFYFHDIVAGPNPTAVQIVRAPSTNLSSTGFGMVAMIDDPLTAGPEPTSKLVGRAQGIYGSASLGDVGLLMALNFAFVDGRNAVMSPVREMPVVGGSGVFRFARGYAQARTRKFNLRTGDAVVEYNVYVFHY